MKPLLLTMGLFPVCTVAHSQTRDSTISAQAGKPAACEGDRKGSGWMRMWNGSKVQFAQSETVRRKLGGLVFTFETCGAEEGAQSGNPKFAYEGFSVMSYDAMQHQWHMISYQQTGETSSDGKMWTQSLEVRMTRAPK